MSRVCFFFFQAEDGIRDLTVTGVQTCALPISLIHRVRRIRKDTKHDGAVRLVDIQRGNSIKVQYDVSNRNELHRESPRSEEHTSELQSQSKLVCRLLLDK